LQTQTVNIGDLASDGKGNMMSQDAL